jgi:hypothetical protein
MKQALGHKPERRYPSPHDLVRRHPHVSSDHSVPGPDQATQNWDAVVAAEGREDGGSGSARTSGALRASGTSGRDRQGVVTFAGWLGHARSRHPD